MGIVEILLSVAFPVLLGTGVALAAMSDGSPAEFWIARVCFVLAGIDAVGLASYWLWEAGREFSWRYIAAGVAVGIIIPATIGLWHWVDYREEKNLTRLLPATDPMPEAAAACASSEDEFAVIIGASVAAIRTFPYTVLQMGGDEMLAVDKDPKNNSILVSTLRIFDDRGNIIARIDKDGFWVEPSTRRKRPDKSTLVVYDRLDHEVLRIRFINNRAISVQGIFRHRSAGFVRITENDLELPGQNRIIIRCMKGGRAAIVIR